MKLAQTMRVASNATECKKVGQTMGESLQAGMIVLIDGPVGSGKTVFVQGIATALGIQEPIQSPSYAIIHEYVLNSGAYFYHLDLYRIRSQEEVIALGIPSLIDSNAIMVCEWTKHIRAYLPSTYINVTLKVKETGERIINIVRVK